MIEQIQFIKLFGMAKIDNLLQRCPGGCVQPGRPEVGGLEAALSISHSCRAAFTSQLHHFLTCK